MCILSVSEAFVWEVCKRRGPYVSFPDISNCSRETWMTSIHRLPKVLRSHIAFLLSWNTIHCPYLLMTFVRLFDRKAKEVWPMTINWKLSLKTNSKYENKILISEIYSCHSLLQNCSPDELQKRIRWLGSSKCVHTRRVSSRILWSEGFVSL